MMPRYVTPSTEETETSGHVIEATTTAEVGIVGFVDQVNTELPVAIGAWNAFERTFGDVVAECLLGRAVHGFFENGGERCHVLLVDRRRVPVAALDALSVLKDQNQLSAICMPDLVGDYRRGVIGAEDVQAVQQDMIAHCEQLGNRIAILDAPSSLAANDAHTWRNASGFDSRFAALYWPWIRTKKLGDSAETAVPPSGHIAGMWARSDARQGVHKAPVNELLRGATGLEAEITSQEHDLLRAAGINVIRSAPVKGIRSWGARTLSSDPAFRYINVRRLLNYIESSIASGTRWVISQPNDAYLWQRIVQTISTFLTSSWRQGALFGATPAEAFYVRCDDELNPPDFADDARVAFEIGVAPVRPFDFLVFRVIQSPGSATVLD